MVALAAEAGVSAQHAGPSFRQALEVEQLLPQSSVYDILEDQAGFLWFGTREGVVRWDGYQVRTWKHDPFDTASLPGNVVRLVDEDRFGNIWVLTHNYLDRPAGLARLLPPDYGHVERVRATGRVFLDQQGNPLLITGDSILHFDPTRSVFAHGFPRTPPSAPRLVDNMLASAAVDLDGIVWSISHERGVERCHLADARCEAVPHPTDRWQAGGRIRIAPDGNLWIPSGRELFRWGNGRLTREALLERRDGAIDLSWSSDGTRWVLGRAGITRQRADSTTQSPLLVLGGAPNPAPIVIRTDRAGTIWVGSVWGLYRHDPAAPVFGHLEHDPRSERSLSAGLVVSLAETPDGAVWIGTIGGGVNRWDRASGDVRRYRAGGPRSGLSSDVAWSLAVGPAGSVWVGTDWGVNRISPDGRAVEQFFRVDEAQRHRLAGSPNAVSDLAFDHSGRLWIACGTYCGDSLFYFDPVQRQFGGVATPGVAGVSYMEAVDSTGILLGALTGVFRFEIPKHRAVEVSDSVPSNLDGILAFLPARNGNLWLGTNSGLYLLDRAGAIRARYTERDGLPGNTIYGLLQDHHGRIWTSTNRGLAVVENTAGGPVVRTYDRSNGLGNVEFNRNAALAARDGTFLFGGDRGITYFDPERIEPNRYRPPVVITSARRSTQRGTRVVTDLSHQTLVVAPDDYTFTIEFAALSYRNPHRNRYQVMLDGFDKEWRSQGTERRTTYTNVPPGEYQFLVRGANDDGLWNPEPAVLAVVVEPALWETAWFRTLVFVLAVGTIALATWYVSRSRYRLEIEATRAQHALDLERTRISRDMHDEVGAHLTEITILSELAMADGPDRSRLERISAKSRATLDSIAEIVWATNPHNDDGDRFAAYLRGVAADYLESAGLRAVLDFPGPGVSISVRADHRRTVLLVLKEALANVVKHANAQVVAVTLVVGAEGLEMTVADDGRGIVSSAPGAVGGNGLRNMRARAEESGGHLTIEPAPDGGTRLTLTLPVGRLPGGADRGAST